MKLYKLRTIYLSVGLILILFMANGCAVLTTSQVKEVKRFAEASQNYSELPGTLAQSYGVLVRNSKLLSITREEFGQSDKQGRIDTSAANNAWEKIQSAYKDETEFASAGKQMDAALSVLQTYSDLLTLLVSDDYAAALSNNAIKLGKSLDEATDKYNRKYRNDDPMDKVGGLIAMGIRSAGGIYTRVKQASILKTTIKEANPLIIDLMDEVQTIASEKIKPALVNYEMNYIGKDFKSVANNNKKVNISTVSFVYDNVYMSRQLLILSDQIAMAAETYKKAHNDLVEKTRVRKTLKEAMQQIEALSNEVNAANKVKKDLAK